MDKLHQLVIRACQTRNPVQRLSTLSNRFYRHSSGDKNTSDNLVKLLAEVADQYLDLKLYDVTEIINNENIWKYGIVESDTINFKLIKYLIAEFQACNKAKLKGLSVPAYIKNKQWRGTVLC